jgi:hypothetical protein
MCNVYDLACKSYDACHITVAAEFDARGSATAKDANLDSSVEAPERVCQEVWSLLAKFHSILDHIRDMAIPKSMISTTAGIIKALAPKDDGEDPLIAAVHQQVMTGSKSVFSMLMMHKVECDFKKITNTYPKGKDGHDKSTKDFLERAREMANRLALFLADINAKRKAAREQKRTMKGASSSKATGSAT